MVTAGSDYTATSGVLTFAAGETEKTVSVPVFDDAQDEGGETLTLANPGPSSVRPADAPATGTIADAMPKAWIARFGRTVAEQVLDAVERRTRTALPRPAGLCGLALAFLFLTSLFAAPVNAQHGDLSLIDSFPLLVHNHNSTPGTVIDSRDGTYNMAPGFIYEQEFTTGPHSPGYRLRSVYFVMEFNSDTTLSTTLYKGAEYLIGLAHNGPNAMDGDSFEDFYFTPTWPSNTQRKIDLLKDTTYTFRIGITSTSTGTAKIFFSKLNGEAGLSGWSIADTNASGTRPLSLSVWGVPKLGAPRNFTGTVDYSNDNVELIWFDVDHAPTGEVKSYRLDTCFELCSLESGWTRLSDVTKNVFGLYIYTHEGGASEAIRRYRVSAFNDEQWAAAYWETPARPIAIKIGSTPVTGDTFRTSENVDIWVTFNKSVRVRGAPKLHLALGNDSANLIEVAATYYATAQETIVKFRYTVEDGIIDTSGGLQLYSNPIRTDATNYIAHLASHNRGHLPRTVLTNWEALTPRRNIDGTNRAPVFSDDDRTGSISETIGDDREADGVRIQVNRAVGAPVTATDLDKHTLTYSLEGTDAASFQIDSSSGQISTKLNRKYDFEVKSSYSVTVKADDGRGGTDTVAVSITVTDVAEPPLAPDAPRVSRISGSFTSLDASWTAPANSGRPDIDHYDVQYRVARRGEDWMDGPQDVSVTSNTFTGLTEGTRYGVRVRAVNDEGDGAWSRQGGRSTLSMVLNAAPTGAHKTVTLAEDGSYTFKAADFGFSDTDSGDALASVTTVTLPGSSKGTLALDGTAVAADGSVTRAELDAGDLVYTPPANANGDDYAAFTFTVSDGTDESASDYTMTLDVTAVNDAATGRPTISGTARVGQTLMASQGTIADIDGLPDVSTLTYQWLRVDGSDDTNIAGATSNTYALVAADAGKKFKVTVGFTDGDGTVESRTSAAYPTSGSVVSNAVPTGAHKTVTLAEDGSYTFTAADFGFSDTDSGDALASVTIVTAPAAGTGTLALDGTALAADGSVTRAGLDAGELVYTPPPNANGDDYAAFTFTVSDGTDESASDYTMTLDVTAVNDAATGRPTISGTARVGQTLTASQGTIADIDGLPDVSTFTYQWLRVDGGSDTAIAGATSNTYALVAADTGKKFKVTVGFTDDDGTVESRTSAVYPTSGSVRQNVAPMGAHKTVTLAEDGSYTFKVADFGFSDNDNFTSLSGDMLVSEREDRDGAGCGHGHAGTGRDGAGGERIGDQGRAGRRRAGLHAAGERQRRRLRRVHLHGERRHGRERVGLHDDAGRDGGERRRDGAADDRGHGAGGPDADGDEGHDCGR